MKWVKYDVYYVYQAYIGPQTVRILNKGPESIQAIFRMIGEKQLK